MYKVIFRSKGNVATFGHKRANTAIDRDRQRPIRYLLAVADVPDREGDEVTAAKLAVDSKVEVSLKVAARPLASDMSGG